MSVYQCKEIFSTRIWNLEGSQDVDRSCSLGLSIALKESWFPPLADFISCNYDKITIKTLNVSLISRLPR